MKTCTKCREVKSLDMFADNPMSRDGKGYYCNTCERIRWKERYQRKKNAIMRKKESSSIGVEEVLIPKEEYRLE